MKAYVFDDVEHLTASYHDGGGAVVVTDRDPAVVLTEWSVREREGVYGADVEPLPVVDEPVAVYEVGDAEERVFAFPDKGCC